MNTLLRAYAQQRDLQISVHDRNYAEIIELLQLAEREGPKQHEMTPLAWAGRYIRKSMPEFSPELYGEKKLRSILEVTDMFEVESIPHASGSGNPVLYRSKPFSGKPEYHLFPVE